MSAYTIVNSGADQAAESLPAGILGSGEYLVIEAIDVDDTPPTNTGSVTFKLGSEDSLTLFKDGVISDTLGRLDGGAESGTSYGLLPDGTGSAQTQDNTAFAQDVFDVASLIRSDVTADPSVFFSIAEFESALTTDTGQVFSLTDFITQRTASIQSQLDGTTASADDGSGFCWGGDTGGPGGRPR